MYIKSLEIQGFKSFPDKTVLTFNEDITAIVGPNGSGKSNISDAIRWVMGEQSVKSLRGGKMEDVIFGGTKLRKQTGFAEVSLVLDNSSGQFAVETTEVMVTRRYYRSGDSEYYINKHLCRLRDVNELFMDTGLGKEGYSIIGQGKIDEILSVRSEDRRQIFEEAAGISRFRHRKEESERRLERTEENLVRINDKISELELQVEPLREQAEKTKKYNILREEQRGLEVSLWMEQLDRLRAGSSKLMTDYAEAVRQKDEAAAEQANLEAHSDELAERQRQKDIRADTLRAERTELETQRADTDSRAAVLRNKIENGQETIRSIEAELGSRQEREASVTAQIEESENRLKELDGQEAALNTDLTAAGQEALALTERITAAGQELADLRTREAEDNNAAGEAKATLSALAAASQELLDHDTALRSSVSALRDSLQENAEELAAHKKKTEDAEENRTAAKNRVDAWKLKAQTRQQRAQRLTDQVNRLQVEDNTLRGRMKMLSDMEKMYEGYSRAVKTLMNESARGGLKGIRGPVANLIRVKDTYTVAIETAMGSAMQNIVTDTEEAGKQAMNWLKRRDAGRATFLPMNVIRGRELKENGLDDEYGFVGLASGLVDCAEEYRPIITDLLGRTAVAEDIDSAIAIANRHGHRFRIVTLDGQVLNAGGSMTGGSASKSGGILSRANELKRLAEQAEKLSADRKNAEEQLAEAKREADKFAYQVETAAGELREAEDAILRLEGENSRLRFAKADLESRLEASEKELNTLSDRSGTTDQAIDAAREKIGTLEAAAAQTREAGKAKEAVYAALTEEASALNLKIADLKQQLAALTAEKESTGRAREQLRGLLSGLSGDREDRSRLLETTREDIHGLEELAEQEESAAAELRKKVTELDNAISAVTNEKMEIEAERSRTERACRDKQAELLEMQREVSTLEQKKLAAETEENALLDKLWENYELSHSAAQQVRMPIESTTKATRRVSELKRAINALGTINPAAVEEFERVNERYTYLSTQRDDAAHSKEELLKIIDGITGEMEKIFRVEFKKIQESFSETFLELFGGGRASLELENENDILNCGIEIKVQPPGKALKIITLLSGGEKAFVAIALYYAILKVRPTPFVVMDEIEAALDDSNVTRFAHYLRRLTDHTQFIVITHRRGTMEEADVLYGVTMQEQGISRMLTINLNEVEQTLHLNAN